MLNITTYRRDQFAGFRNQLKSEGYELVSVLSLTGEGENALQARGRNMAFDVSSLLPLLDPSSKNRDLGAVFEALLYRMPESTVFIADEVVASKYSYEMRNIFDIVRPCSIGGDIEGQTMPSEEKPKRLTDLSDAETEALLDQFDSSLIGQDKFKIAFRKHIKMFRLFNSIGEQPILSLFLIGPSGVGKTETARILSSLLAPEERLSMISFGNYSSKDSLNSLIGSPRGYLGSEEGELTMKIKSNKSGVILIDEFEKGDSAVWNFFLELLESGRFTDSQGDGYDLNGYVIVFTSNAPRAVICDAFPPELLSRFNLKTNFSSLSDEEKELFTQRYIASVAEKYRSRIDGTLEKTDVIAGYALKEIDTASEDNIRVLKNSARIWFMDYIAERNNSLS